MPSLPASVLAGGSLRDRAIAAIGALIGITLTGLIGAACLLDASALPWIVGPMGASAVLVFAVPASPLAQPWPVIGGNVIGALVGVAVAKLVPVPHLAAGIAVAAAILAMSLARCLHPPGGAAALTAVIGGEAVHAAGYGFALLPVGVNALVLAALAVLFHRVSGHAYPHRRGHGLATPDREDLDRALEDVGETLDVTRDDLELLFERIAHHAARRRRR